MATAALFATAQAAAPLAVSMMPSYNQNPTYANAAINEPIQVWGRVSGGSGTYINYDLDFGDGTSTSFNFGGPVLGPATIDAITFEILDTCNQIGTYTCYLNGVLIGSGTSNPAHSCTCTPPLTSFTVNNAALLAAHWVPNSADNTLRIDVAGSQYVAWARAQIISGASTQAAYLINGNNGDQYNGNMNLCTAGYRSLNAQSFSNTELYAPAAGAFQIPEGPDFLKEDHTYTTGGSKTVTLTVTDSAGNTASRSAVIRVLPTPTHDERVNMAIEKGLIYLYRTQTRYTPTAGVEGSWWYGSSGEVGNAAGGASLMCFGENGHLADNDPVLDVYAETVKRGVYHLITRGRHMAISTTVAGQDPDANGNALGIYEDAGQAYSHSFVMMGIVNAFPNGAAAEAATIPAGLWSDGAPAPANVKDFVQDMLDSYSYSQSEGSGGWHYAMVTHDSSGFDGSTHQWPNISILSAKERWGITPPAWVVSRSMTAFINGTDHTGGAYDGGTGYTSAGSWRNCAKTGGALVGYYLGGKLVGEDADADRAMTFISRYWGSYAAYNGSDGHGWLGDLYAMFALKKGLQLQGVSTIATTPGGVADGVVHDWYDELSGWLLGNSSLVPAAYVGPGRDDTHAFGQLADGSWVGPNSYPGSYGAPIITPHAILVLTKAVTIPLPVAVIAPVADQSARVPGPITLDGTASYHQDPGVPLVEWLWILDAGATPDWNSPDGSGQTFTDNPGWDTESVHTATLRVKDNQDPANYSFATININVTLDDVAPVAVPIPASMIPPIYTAQIGQEITLDGTESYDPEGDPIISYAWNLDGNLTYGDAADALLDTSGQNAAGSTAIMVFGAEYTGQVGLQVCSQPDIEGAPAKCGVSQTPIEVYVSPSDLSVVSITAANVVVGVSADIAAIVANAVDSGSPYTGVIVRFYDGDPFTTGAQIGGNYLVDLSIGGTETVVASVALSAGQEFVFVKVDANNVITEYNEANNTGKVNVANKPPTASLAALGLIACNDELTVTATVGDLDGDALTADWRVDSDPFATHNLAAGATEDSISNVFGYGEHTVEITVTDGKSDPVTATMTFTIEDTEDPVITGCPENILVYTGLGRTTCDQEATWTPPLASDNCTVDFTTDWAPGSTFPVGTTTVTCTATDGAGNQAVCTFTVTVVDTTAPVISGCPTDIIVNNDLGVCGALVSYLVPVGADNCPGAVTMAQTTGLASGATFPTGTTLNTFVFSDAAGNTADCSFNVTVIDAEDPQIACPADIEVENDLGVCGAVVIYPEPEFSDNCPGAVAVQVVGLASGETFPVGTTVNTFMVTDASGNTATCSFSVTVLDVEAPVITTCLPAVSVPFDGEPDAAITVTEFLDQGGVVSDNCNLAEAVTSADSVAGLCPTIVTRTYTLTDTSGNEATCEQIITVNNLFAGDGIVWHQPLARNGMSEDTDPGAGNTLKYRFKLGSTIPIQIHAQGCSAEVTENANVIGKVEVFGDTDMDGVSDGNALLIDYNGVGEAGGFMDKIGPHLKYNLATKKLPVQTSKCYVLQVTITDTSTGESRVETVPLQSK